MPGGATDGAWNRASLTAGADMSESWYSGRLSSGVAIIGVLVVLGLDVKSRLDSGGLADPSRLLFAIGFWVVLAAVVVDVAIHVIRGQRMAGFRRMYLAAAAVALVLIVVGLLLSARA